MTWGEVYVPLMRDSGTLTAVDECEKVTYYRHVLINFIHRKHSIATK